MVRIFYDFIRDLYLIQKINKKKFGNVKSLINFANVLDVLMTPNSDN
jgi:hypothetical protein